MSPTRDEPGKQDGPDNCGCGLGRGWTSCLAHIESCRQPNGQLRGAEPGDSVTTPESRVMKFKLAAVAVGALAVILSSCGGDEGAADPSVSATAATTTQATTTPPAAMSTTTLPIPTTTVEAATETIEPAPPTIVGCQNGYNPVETTWSDGTVTGYSDYCQSVRDKFRQGEIVPESGGPTQYVCESGLPCGLTEEDGVVCDETGCHAI